MKKISKKELKRMIQQAQLNAIVGTLFIMTIFTITLAGIIYMFMK